MKKFLIKIAALVGAVIICTAALSAFDVKVIGPQFGNNFQAALLDKLDRLKSLEGPKIILLGNSNLPFGIDSQMLEEAFGMPVVNMGLHGGIGNAYEENVAKQDIGKGDIVILCHTDYSDDDDLPEPALAWITYDCNEEILSLFRKKDLPELLWAYPPYLLDAFQLWISGTGNRINEYTSYIRPAFNEYGDIVYRPDNEQVDVEEYFKDTEVSVPEINDICVRRINRLNEFCEEKEAKLLVAGYPVAYGEYSDFNEADFAEFQNRLAERLDCAVISDFRDYFYPYSYFFNTYLHLTAEGAEIRTQQLIEDISEWM